MNTQTTIIRKLFLLTAILFYGQVILAVPAIPTPVTITQPNGDSVKVLIKGDERINWYETMDGYTLLYNNDNYLSYAVKDSQGDLQPSVIKASSKPLPSVRSGLSIEKGAFFSQAQIEKKMQLWKDDQTKIQPTNLQQPSKIGKSKSFSTKTTFKTICAFVQFPEKQITTPLIEFENLINQVGYTKNGTGSVRDYFREVSYGQFDIETTFFGTYTAPKSEAYYAGRNGRENFHELARWIAEQIAAETDLSQYDNNNDGKVDGFHIIFAGRGQETGGGSEAVWSHKGMIITPITVNGKSISIYSCSSELLVNQITTIGVICHEMSHTFGARDYYDHAGYYKGAGTWDLMASGSWNGMPVGNCPAHINIYEKIRLDWVTPITLNTPTTITGMPNSVENPIAYRIDTYNKGEYFLLENRQKLKFDSDIPGSGLLISRVTEPFFYPPNGTHPQRLYPVCAGATVEIPNSDPESYGDIYDAATTFPGTTGNTSFTDTSIPSAKSWLGVTTGKPITEITHSNQLIGFKFMDSNYKYNYTVVFHPNRGLSTTQKIVPHNELVPRPDQQQIRIGYTFDGWYKEPGCINEWNFDKDRVTENTTLYAKWVTGPVQIVVKDMDNNTYETVQIGNQLWTVQNWKSTKYNDKTSIPLISNGRNWNSNTKDAMCYYAYNAIDKHIYGGYYNWHAVNTGKIAPDGWRIPSKEDWNVLENYLNAYGYNYDGSTSGYNYDGSTGGYNIGKALSDVNKPTVQWENTTEIGAIGNKNDHPEKNNASGFSALPTAGIHWSGATYPLRATGFWWTSSLYNNTTGFSINAHYDYPFFILGQSEFNCGYSIRLVKDISPLSRIVTFNSNGGSPVYAQVIESGDKIPTLVRPFRLGYTFKGWYKEEAHINAWNLDTDCVNDNITLYAKWQSPTGITEDKISDIRIFATSGMIVIEDIIPGESFSITTVTGNVVYSQLTASSSRITIPVLPGAYIVQVGHRTVKVIVI